MQKGGRLVLAFISLEAADHDLLDAFLLGGSEFIRLAESNRIERL